MRNDDIINRYKSGEHAQKLADEYGITPRQVQRICGQAGVIRTQSESYKLAIQQGRMKYYRKPEHLKAGRKTLKLSVRYKVLDDADYRCCKCGSTANDGVRIEVDHIDNDATNNSLSNLQVLCDRCNKGKTQQ